MLFILAIDWLTYLKMLINAKVKKCDSFGFSIFSRNISLIFKNIHVYNRSKTKVVVLFVALAERFMFSYGVCFSVCGQIDILCKKLTPGGSVLALKILQEVLKDSSCKKLTPGGSVLA